MENLMKKVLVFIVISLMLLAYIQTYGLEKAQTESDTPTGVELY
jgi:uncharacterized oligopeptide transporter (OPT) family protein